MKFTLGQTVTFRENLGNDNNPDAGDAIRTGTIREIRDNAADVAELKHQGSWLATLPVVPFYVVSVDGVDYEVREAQVVK